MKAFSMANLLSTCTEQEDELLNQLLNHSPYLFDERVKVICVRLTLSNSNSLRDRKKFSNYRYSNYRKSLLGVSRDLKILFELHEFELDRFDCTLYTNFTTLWELVALDKCSKNVWEGTLWETEHGLITSLWSCDYDKFIQPLLSNMLLCADNNSRFVRYLPWGRRAWF